jgi:hypothetical protein
MKLTQNSVMPFQSQKTAPRRNTTFKVTSLELRDIKRRAEEAGLSMSDYVRRALGLSTFSVQGEKAYDNRELAADEMKRRRESGDGASRDW